MDYGLRIGRGHAGLSFFDPLAYTATPWNSWETFRVGAVGVDFGSDGSANARSYHFKVAVECFLDQSHINIRVAYNALQEVELNPLAKQLVGGVEPLARASRRGLHVAPDARGSRGNVCEEAVVGRATLRQHGTPNHCFVAADGRRRRARRAS